MQPTGPTILVIEDSLLMQRTLRAVLAPAEYQLDIVGTGAAGVARLDAGGVDLLLLDLLLPDMNGLDICRHVRQDSNAVYLPIIMVTSMESLEERQAGFAAGADDYVVKPFTPEDLLARVQVWIQTRHRLKTAHEEREAALAAVARQAHLLELASDAIFVRDLSGRIVYWNAAAEALYGWSRAEAVGRGAHRLLHTAGTVTREEAEATVMREGHWEGEVVHYQRDGTRRVMATRWVLERDATGEPRAILELNTDVTAQRATARAAAARQAQTARLEAFANTTETLAGLLAADLTHARGVLDRVRAEATLSEGLRGAVAGTATSLALAAQHLGNLQAAAHAETEPAPARPAADAAPAALPEEAPTPAAAES